MRSATGLRRTARTTSWSENDGRTWSRPIPTSLLGQATYPIAMPDGGVAIFEQPRTDPQIMLAAWSPDGGRSFDPVSEVVVYRHVLPSAGAEDGSIGSQEYLTSMARFTGGHPCGIALDGKRLLVAWYAGMIERTEIRGATLKLRD